MVANDKILPEKPLQIKRSKEVFHLSRGKYTVEVEIDYELSLWSIVSKKDTSEAFYFKNTKNDKAGVVVALLIMDATKFAAKRLQEAAKPNTDNDLDDLPF